MNTNASNFGFLKFLPLLYLLLYSKRWSRIHSFNRKICLKNKPPWTKIFEKNAAKRTRQHAVEKFRKAEYVQRRVCFVNEQVP